MTKEAGVQSQTTTTIKPDRARGERGTGTTITIDLADNLELLKQIRQAAKDDDREPSKWLRRHIVQLSGVIFGTDGEAKP